MKDNGGPAYPVATRAGDIDGGLGHQCGDKLWQFPGMTLRDYFAGQAMIARDEQDYESWREYAWDCYSIADAMLAERAKDT
jgi:hypothetical protein